MPVGRAADDCSAHNALTRLAWGIEPTIRALRDRMLNPGCRAPVVGAAVASCSHWQKSIIRQRTTPYIGRVGPRSTTATSAARSASFRRTWLAMGLAANQPGRAMRIERHHPVPHDLQGHAADPGRPGACGAIVDRGQRQQPPCLASVLAVTRRRPNAGGVDISSTCDRHGETPRFARLEPNLRRVAQPLRVSVNQGWYRSTAKGPRMLKIRATGIALLTRIAIAVVATADSAQGAGQITASANAKLSLVQTICVAER